MSVPRPPTPLLLFEGPPLGCLIVSVGKHALVVQLCELSQLRYPRRLVISGRGRRLALIGSPTRRGRPSGWLARCGSPGRSGWPRHSGGPGRSGGTGAGRREDLLARGIHPELAPEPLDLRHVLGLADLSCAKRRGRARHRAYGRQLRAADLKTPAADGTHQVVVRTVGHHRHEVEGEPLLRADMVEEHLVVAVRAHARRYLAQVLLLARPEAENHHAASEAWARGRRFIR